ncbi:hypothetical protein Tco_0173826 [Tanacetum coccineum]
MPSVPYEVQQVGTLLMSIRKNKGGAVWHNVPSVIFPCVNCDSHLHWWRVSAKEDLVNHAWMDSRIVSTICVLTSTVSLSKWLANHQACMQSESESYVPDV